MTMFEQEFASKEEKLFSYYVGELLEHGHLIEATYQPEPFILSKDVIVHAYEKKKDKNVLIDVKLTRGSSYRADWCLLWSSEAEGIFYWEQGGIYRAGFYPYRKARAGNFIPFFAENCVSYVDIKGGFVARNNTSGVTFPVIQKILSHKGTFVQKVVVSLDEKGIFQRSFTPRNVIRDEVYKRDYKEFKARESKLRYEPKLIEHFVKR